MQTGTQADLLKRVADEQPKKSLGQDEICGKTLERRNWKEEIVYVSSVKSFPRPAVFLHTEMSANVALVQILLGKDTILLGRCHFPLIRLCLISLSIV
ncbi:hypothetical protein J6590_039977 [Homalodisca vitripennis]|nr:hypothetical protein J6590_004646 [Homalodisca vitripennis]KAG8326515.1 hypothetical protein J6590_039977 [Homalodisca vitripennis]